LGLEGGRVTHAELVSRAQRWVRSRRYPIVLADVHTTTTTEQPDVIGFRTGGDTLLVECKASRADFRRDAAKYFRRAPEHGMGYFRWYFAPADVIPVDALPAGWGLVELNARGGLGILRNAQPCFTRDLTSEGRLLVTALRRATEGWGRGMFGDIAPRVVDGDPHPSASRTIRELRAENERLRSLLRDRGGA
jgi:hypothetical protein